MDDKHQLFENKCKQLKQSITSIYKQYGGKRGLNSPLHKEVAVVLANLSALYKSLGEATFQPADDALNDMKVTVYLDIAEQALQLLRDKSFNLAVPPKNGKDASLSTLEGIRKSLTVLTIVEKAIASLTLLLAATPTLIVTLLPVYFSFALDVITPLLIALPPLAITVCAVAGLMLGIKLLEVAYKKCVVKDESLRENLNEIKNDSAKRLFSASKHIDAMSDTAKSRFFRAADVQPSLREESTERSMPTKVA